MNVESSPFSPGRPVPLELFLGREAEIQQLRNLVRASLAGNVQVGFVTGERGIGKSSLVSFVHHLEEREGSIAGVHAYLGGAQTVADLVQNVMDRLLKDSIEKSWFNSVRAFFGKHVREVGLFGVSVELQLGAGELATLTNNFTASLRGLIGKLKAERKGLLLILDDLNGLATSEVFAQWFKSFIDESATDLKPLNLTIIFVGLEERRRSLIALQPSLARIFEVIRLEPWDSGEIEQFYRQAFLSAGVEVEPKALDIMVSFTAGLPVLAQEIGHAVWKATQGSTVTETDAYRGIDAASEIVIHKFLEPQVFQDLRSVRYRSILRKLALSPLNSAEPIRRSDLRTILDEPEARVLDNFLRRMTSLGALVKDPEAGQGAYRFANSLYAFSFWVEARRHHHRDS